MAEKVKLNKSELTRLKQSQKTYGQFLPVLKLKQEQLQLEQIKLKRRYLEAKARYEKTLTSTNELLPLLNETLSFYLVSLLKPLHIELVDRSIAGVKVKELVDIAFSDFKPSIFENPMWIADGLPKLRDAISAKIQFDIINKQYQLIAKELRKSTQKVNLFEKVLIPETKENIKKIKIALGDEQVAQVVRGKIAKIKTSAIASEGVAA